MCVCMMYIARHGRWNLSYGSTSMRFRTSPTAFSSSMRLSSSHFSSTRLQSVRQKMYRAADGSEQVVVKKATVLDDPIGGEELRKWEMRLFAEHFQHFTCFKSGVDVVCLLVIYASFSVLC